MRKVDPSHFSGLLMWRSLLCSWWGRVNHSCSKARISRFANGPVKVTAKEPRSSREPVQSALRCVWNSRTPAKCPLCRWGFPRGQTGPAAPSPSSPAQATATAPPRGRLSQAAFSPRFLYRQVYFISVVIAVSNVAVEMCLYCHWSFFSHRRPRFLNANSVRSIFTNS